MYRLILKFRVSLDNSGKATYYASKAGGHSANHQVHVKDDRYQQEYSFDDVNSALNFIKKAFDEFGTDFEVARLYFWKVEPHNPKHDNS